MLQKLGLDPAEFAAGVGFENGTYAELVDEVWPALKRQLAAAIRRHTRDELQALFEDTDACVTPVLDLEEAANHPHRRERATYIDVGGARHGAPAPRFSRTRPDPPRAAAPVGADTDAVLAELGYGPADIRELRNGRALG
jgi:alpha-methylacyl-CoA racemase